MSACLLLHILLLISLTSSTPTNTRAVAPSSPVQRLPVSATPAESMLDKVTTVIISPFPWWWPGVLIPPKYDEPEDPRNTDWKWGTPVVPPQPVHTRASNPPHYLNGSETENGSRWWHAGDKAENPETPLSNSNATSQASPSAQASRKAVHPDKLSKYYKAAPGSGIHPEHKQAMDNYKAWHNAGSDPSTASSTPVPSWAASIPNEVASNDFESAFRGVKFPGRHAAPSPIFKRDQFEKVVGAMGQHRKWGTKQSEPCSSLRPVSKAKPTGTPQEIAANACDSVLANAHVPPKPQTLGQGPAIRRGRRHRRNTKRDASDTVIDGWGLVRNGRKMQKLVDATGSDPEPVQLERHAEQMHKRRPAVTRVTKEPGSTRNRRKMFFPTDAAGVAVEDVLVRKEKRGTGNEGRYEDLSRREGAGVSRVMVVVGVWLALLALVGMVELM